MRRTPGRVARTRAGAYSQAMRSGPGIYFHHPACLSHDPRVHMPGHPDTPERLIAIEDALTADDWLGWERRPAPVAEESQLELVHTRDHVVAIKEIAQAGGGPLDPVTFGG